MKEKDMTGLRFGRLVAIKVVERRKNGVKWLCKCDCGNEAIVRGNYLRSGHTKSCGCLAKENLKLPRNYSEETIKSLKERARKMGLASRKHFGCMYCGSDKHYAKGLCRSCYGKAKRGTLGEKQ